MTAPVRIEASAWGDLRFATLARLCGFADAAHALIKVAQVWSWQTEHYTPDAPTYEVDPEIVESALGPGGAGHLVRARLAEEGPSGLRIKGSLGRIEWLWKKRQASARGGEATKRKHENKKKPAGPHVAEPEAGPSPGPEIGALPLSPDLPRSEDIHTRVRERHPDAGKVARRTWDHGAKLSAELRSSGIQAPPWALMVDREHPAWKALLDRACELLVDHTPEQAEQICRNRVDVAAAKVRAEPAEARWFACTAMFSRSSFEAFAYLSPEQFTRAPARRERERDDALSAVLRIAKEQA